jgi:hypothetical protein
MSIKHLLTKEQESFIKKNKIPEDLLFDAQGAEMSIELMQEMSTMNKVLAYNTMACDVNASHNFKTISGLCPQCDTSNIASALREYKTGYIYLAGSKKSQLIKVGSANETKDSIKTLTKSESKSGGFDDWELLFHAKTETLGRTERMIQQKLSEYKASYPHEKSGKLLNGSELYRCSYNKVKDALAEVQDEEHFEFMQVKEWKHMIAEYQFKNLRVKLDTVTS